MRIAALAALALAVAMLAACQAQEAEPTAESGAEPVAETTEKTLFVGPETVPCTGVAPMDCLQVKESPDGDWELFYDTIEGFAHEPGYAYELRVQVTTVPDAPADASSVRYTLVEIVSKNPATVSGEASPGAEATLEGPTWLLQSHGDPAAPIPVLEGTEITATFLDGRVSGNGGCNGYFASYEVDGDQLAVGMPGSTMMACDEPIMEQEQAFLAALQQAARFSIEGERLVITTTDDMALSFLRQAAGLDGSEWTVTAFNNGNQAVVGVLPDTEITAVFAEGKVAGNAGCNQYNATFELDGDAIVIGPAVTTRMLCQTPEGVMDQEAQYLAALQSAAAWRRDGSRLELRSAEDAIAVQLAATVTE